MNHGSLRFTFSKLIAITLTAIFFSACLPDDVVTPSNNDNNNNGAATSTDLVRQYTFNHSLWYHYSTQHNNAVTAYWIAEFANASGTEYQWNGQFGQLDYHALPPSPQLGTSNSTSVYPDTLSDDPTDTELTDVFRDELPLDSVLLMPPNFVQYSTDTLDAQISYAERVLDWVRGEGGQNTIPIYIYEHWPEADADVLTEQQWDEYHVETLGSYHEWHLSYLAGIVAAYPEADIRMIPVGPIIAEILQNSDLSLSAMSFEDFYEDNAPHGRNDLYFLAGLVTYQALFGQQVAQSYSPTVDVANGVSVELSNDFSALNAFVWERLHAYQEAGVPIW